MNHRSAPLELREKLAICQREIPGVLDSLTIDPDISEIVILSTCNRTEFYVASSSPAQAIESLVDFLGSKSRLDITEFQSRLYYSVDSEAAKHLFRVTAGLDSMILGESEITAQVKQAYQLAQAKGATGAVLNRLFQKALHSTKLIRSRTCIDRGQASIGSVVTKLTRERLGEQFKRCEVLLWGAGKAAEATARHLAAAGIGQLWIVNRTQTKSQELASLCEGGWVSWEKAQRCLASVDIAIVCTQAPHYVVDEDDMDVILPQRNQRPLWLIDLAVPRNVDPVVGGRCGVHLYNIDDLQAIAQEALIQRKGELGLCEKLIDTQINHFWRWRNAVSHKEVASCQGVSV